MTKMRWLIATVIPLMVGAGPAAAAEAPAAPTSVRDGSHDFDFNFGTWHTSITRLKDPFGTAPRQIHLEGTVTVRPVWGGKAALEEIEADGPDGHWQALTLFLYNPTSGQWSQVFANAREGRISSPPLIGEFTGGRAELYAQDTFGGRSILVRGTWSGIQRDAHSYEEAYSADGGRTWKSAFLGNLTRVAPAAEQLPVAPAHPKLATGDGSRDFDFEFGHWKTDLHRLKHPLSGSSEWIRYSGTTDVREVWGGRANLVELEVDGASGHFQALSLRLYDPAARQWTLNYANSASGTLSVPAATGAFANGRGEFYDQEFLGTRAILVRFIVSDVGPQSAHFEQAYSIDGGKSWEINWRVTDLKPAYDARQLGRT